MTNLGLVPADKAKPEDAPPTARFFYAAYFKKTAPGELRPVTFLYNGGPGSSTMWLHLGVLEDEPCVNSSSAHFNLLK